YYYLHYVTLIYKTNKYFGSKPETIHPPKNTSPRCARSAVSRVGNPITNGTSLGLPPFGIGSMSIGKNVNGSQIAIAINDGRMVVRPYLRKSTHAAIKNGRLTNRYAPTQKRVATSRTRRTIMQRIRG